MTLKSFLQNQNTASFDTFKKMVMKNGVFYLFAIRMIPVFPFYLVNVFMAFTPIKVIPYGLVTLIGIAPMTIAYVYFGSQINKIRHVSEILSPKILVIFKKIKIIFEIGVPSINSYQRRNPNTNLTNHE